MNRLYCEDLKNLGSISKWVNDVFKPLCKGTIIEINNSYSYLEMHIESYLNNPIDLIALKQYAYYELELLSKNYYSCILFPEDCDEAENFTRFIESFCNFRDVDPDEFAKELEF